MSHDDAMEGNEMTTTGTGRWVSICEVGDIAEDEGYPLATVPPLALFRQGDEVFCLEDNCSHEDYKLSEGWVEDCSVECALHAAKFDLRSGKALCLPATQPVRTFEVRIDGGSVQVMLPDDIADPA